jgi:hypothetical protein
VAKQIVKTDTTLRIFSVFFVLPQNILRDQTKSINFKALTKQYYETVYVLILLPSLSSMQFTSSLRRNMWSSVVCVALSHFATLSYKLNKTHQLDIIHNPFHGIKSQSLDMNRASLTHPQELLHEHSFGGCSVLQN